MVKQIVRDIFFLGQPSEPATQADLSVGRDLLDTLQANREACVGMAANMIGVKKNIIIVNMGLIDVVMFNPVIIPDGEDMRQRKDVCPWKGFVRQPDIRKSKWNTMIPAGKSNGRNCPDGQLRSRSMRSIIYRERSFSGIMARVVVALDGFWSVFAGKERRLCRRRKGRQRWIRTKHNG